MKVLRVAFLVVTAMVALENKASAIAVTADSYTADFFGQCTVDCQGQGHGTLSLHDYILGSALSTSNFTSFTYSSSLLSFTILNGDTGLGLLGSIGGSGTNIVSIANSGHSFASDLSGAWCAGNGPTCTTVVNLDAGVEGSWQVANNGRVPEPGSLALAAAGLAGLVVVARRKRTSLAAVRH